MIGIVIVGHGHLAREYLAAVEHVVGPQQNMRAISIDADHDRADKRAEICAAANEVDSGAGVVLVSDLFGGSPSNLCHQACMISARRIIFGANLPLLIKLAKSRNAALDTAVSRALEAGHKYMDCKTISPEGR